MNWLKNLFKSSNNEQTSVTQEIVGQSKIVEQEEPPTPDISEPVYSFVETVRKHPGRFIILYGGSTTKCEEWVDRYENIYFLFDKKVRLNWTFSMLEAGGVSILEDFPDFLTKEEARYIHNTFKDIYKERKAKLETIKQQRKARQHELTRQKYISIYCGEED